MQNLHGFALHFLSYLGLTILYNNQPHVKSSYDKMCIMCIITFKESSGVCRPHHVHEYHEYILRKILLIYGAHIYFFNYMKVL